MLSCFLLLWTFICSLWLTRLGNLCWSVPNMELIFLCLPPTSFASCSASDWWLTGSYCSPSPLLLLPSSKHMFSPVIILYLSPPYRPLTSFPFSFPLISSSLLTFLVSSRSHPFSCALRSAPFCTQLARLSFRLSTTTPLVSSGLPASILTTSFKLVTACVSWCWYWWCFGHKFGVRSWLWNMKNSFQVCKCKRKGKEKQITCVSYLW